MVKDSKPTEYLSHYYEYPCDKCKQPIQKNTPYHLLKRHINVQGERVTEFYRAHVKCPDIAGK